MTPRSFQDALLELVPSLRAYARLLTGTQHRADDLVQDTLLQAWDRREALRDQAAMRAWAFRIMHNLCLRQARKYRLEVEDVDDTCAASIAVDPAQHHALELSELSDAVECLTGDEQEALFVVAIDNMSYEDASRTLGISVGTVKSRVHRARAKLADKIDGRSERQRSARWCHLDDLRAGAAPAAARSVQPSPVNRRRETRSYRTG